MKKEIKEKGKNFIHEFREFIARGSVIDLAVGVVIGSAFGKIVTSIVEDILMPIIGIIIGGINFNTLTITVGDATIRYGAFLNNIIDFLIIAFCIFVVVKLMNKMVRKEEKKKVEPPKKSDEVILLEEIRDLLKKKTK